ncbi:MAG: phytoene/squalene synthase family protein [Pseudomonadota bacterium]
MPDAIKNDISHCMEQVRRFDNDRYIASLFSPKDRLDHLFALYAFNLEVAKTAEVVSEPMIGQIRLQWWRDALTEIRKGKARRHAVVQPLERAIETYRLDPDLLEGLIDAREFDLKRQAPKDLKALEAYAAATSASLNQLALTILGPVDPQVIEAGRQLGKAWALTGLMRAIPFHAAQKRCFIPSDIATNENLTLGDLFELRPSRALSASLRPLWTAAQDFLENSQSLNRKAQKEGRGVFLLAKLCRLYLERLDQAELNPFDDKVQRPLSGRTWRLFIANLMGF